MEVIDGVIQSYSFAIKGIIIPNSVTTIRNTAFIDNSLTSVIFEPNSYIRYIGVSAFVNNSELTRITLPTNSNTGFLGYKEKSGNSYNTGDNITNFRTCYHSVLPTHTLILDEIDFVDGTITNYLSGYVDIIFPASYNINGVDVNVTTI